MFFDRLVRLAAVPSLLVMLVLPFSRGSAQTWDSQESGTFGWFSAVQFLDDQVGWVTGADGMILKTTDGGEMWVGQNSGRTSHFSDHHFLNESIGWVVGQDGVIQKTTDGGSTWISQTSGTTSWLNKVHFVDEQTGWAAGVNGTVIKTTNGGTTWTLQPTGFTNAIEGGCFVTTANAWLACAGGNFLKTNDGGSSWATELIAPPYDLNAVHFFNASTGWAVGGGGMILKTTDGGGSWSEQTSGTTEAFNEVSFVNADTGWAVGNNGVIKVTFNGGATWQTQPSLTTENLRSVFFTDPSHGWAVGLFNTILRYELVQPLPIQLASFVATPVNNNAVRISWTTISEVNNFGFYVQRSNDQSSGFTSLTGSFVPGHGTTNMPHEYGFTDNSATSGRWYYRLHQIDLDGTNNYTEPVSVDIVTGVEETALPTAFSLKQNYPNPFNPTTKIEFSIAKSGFVSLKVYDIVGREVATLINQELNQGTYLKTVSGENLSSGMYMYKLVSGNYSETKKFILSK